MAGESGRTMDGYTVFGPASTGEEIDEHLTNASWEKNLTADEKLAFEDYTSVHSIPREVNTYLRTMDEGVASEWAKTVARDLESAINKSTIKENVMLHRNADASLLGGKSTMEEIRRMIGKRVTDDGFGSYSAKEDFEKITSKRIISYHVKFPKGHGAAYVQNMSKFKHEHEVLLNKDSVFEVVGAHYDSAGRIHVSMNYVGRTNGRK